MSTQPKSKFFAVNLNTVLTGVVTAILIAVLSNGYTINKSIIELSFKSDEMSKKMQDIIPRAELETRFKVLESQVLEVKVRMQAVELEIMKLRESRHWKERLWQ